MAKTSHINIRIDPETKSQAEILFGKFGMTVSEAVNVFLHQSIMYGGIPFELRVPNGETMEALDDVINHRNLEGPFGTVEDLMEALNN
ncbi:MAG: type II toxin-antitoxin system RelB/DinJ family antitoxin [Oscillospiraceae bacterium]|nr:type II toxin-antitoxin system RelB/DinJ family antitoxin [Oscillospiraceae bacterium]